MATNIDTSRLSGMFKDRFGEFGEVLPEEGFDVLGKRIKFDEALMLGEKVTQPIRVQAPLGFTFAGGNTTGTMFALNDANSGRTVEATWTSQEFVIREKTSWKALRAAVSDAQAFGNQYDDIAKTMKRSALFAREWSMLYGGSSIAVIESGTGSSTSRVYTLSKASSAAMVWWYLNGALLDVYNAASGGTKINTNADVVVAGVDLNDSTGKIEVSVTGNATDLTAIDNSSAYGYHFVFKGSEGNTMVGIDGICNATTYAGITLATYPIFATTSLNAGSAGATFSKFMHAMDRNTIKSGPGKRSALISTATARDLIDNATALQRMVNKAGGKFEIGANSLEYHSWDLDLEFVPHRMVKQGEAFLLDFNELSRIGSTDFTFDPTGHGEYFEHVSGYAGLELMGYWDQGLRCPKPSTITKITGIVNTY